jgi:hypothetical protein
MDPPFGDVTPRAGIKSPLGHTICTYPADFGHGRMSPERKLTPVPGAQPADLRSSLPHLSAFLRFLGAEPFGVSLRGPAVMHASA